MGTARNTSTKASNASGLRFGHCKNTGLSSSLFDDAKRILSVTKHTWTSTHFGITESDIFHLKVLLQPKVLIFYFQVLLAAHDSLIQTCTFACVVQRKWGMAECLFIQQPAKDAGGWATFGGMHKAHLSP